MSVTLGGVVQMVSCKLIMAWKKESDVRLTGYIQDRSTQLLHTPLTQFQYSGRSAPSLLLSVFFCYGAMMCFSCVRRCVWTHSFCTDRVTETLSMMGENQNPLVELLCQVVISVDF